MLLKTWSLVSVPLSPLSVFVCELSFDRADTSSSLSIDTHPNRLPLYHCSVVMSLAITYTITNIHSVSSQQHDQPVDSQSHWTIFLRSTWWDSGRESRTIPGPPPWAIKPHRWDDVKLCELLRYIKNIKANEQVMLFWTVTAK